MENDVLSPKVKKIARDDVEIKVHYVDSLGKEISKPVTIKGHYLDKLDIPWQEIPGYVLSSVTNFQQTFIPNSDGIYLVYASQLSAPVIVYHRNTDGNLIADPQYLEGELNRQFDSHPLQEADHFLVHSPKEPHGQFTNKVQEQEYVYNVLPVREFKIKKNLYIRTKDNVNVFSEPTSKVPLDKPLPFGTDWKVYRAVQETYNSTIWYNLGGNTWIPNSERIMTRIIQQPTSQQEMLRSLLSETASNISYTYSVIDSMNINRSVKILYYSDQFVTAWKTPYGDMDNQRYQGGQFVFVKTLVQLDNYSVWAQLDDGYYIESKYLNL
ncbi:MucBP domain-containing protein [Companilactobacillus paralimentarius]|uniref:MucBP domain-containing protein n=1 Tax=Companilactobacillus paralimentarius TaxID=83526 RepID=UPI0028535FBB|nr:MucBP domain-containing protein [Companilactobacillus paralimentarius]MDR4934644.1 MucBP domain-containing protein [Companilactobacillus paralimentarius]